MYNNAGYGCLTGIVLIACIVISLAIPLALVMVGIVCLGLFLNAIDGD